MASRLPVPRPTRWAAGAGRCSPAGASPLGTGTAKRSVVRDGTAAADPDTKRRRGKEIGRAAGTHTLASEGTTYLSSDSDGESDDGGDALAAMAQVLRSGGGTKGRASCLSSQGSEDRCGRVGGSREGGQSCAWEHEGDRCTSRDLVTAGEALVSGTTELCSMCQPAALWLVSCPLDFTPWAIRSLDTCSDDEGGDVPQLQAMLAGIVKRRRAMAAAKHAARIKVRGL